MLAGALFNFLTLKDEWNLFEGRIFFNSWKNVEWDTEREENKIQTEIY